MQAILAGLAVLLISERSHLLQLAIQWAETSLCPGEHTEQGGGLLFKAEAACSKLQ